MVNKLESSKRANKIEGIESVRYMRENIAAELFGLPYNKIIYFAEAAGAVYRLPRITLIHRKKLEVYMNHLHKVPNTGKYVEKKFVRIGEGSVTYSMKKKTKRLLLGLVTAIVAAAAGIAAYKTMH